jgi:hypothetical protein
MSQKKTVKLRGRAVGDQDATSGPMDGGPAHLARKQDAAAVEKDRAKSSGRPPLARTARAPEDDGTSDGAPVEPQRVAKPRVTRRGPPPAR